MRSAGFRITAPSSASMFRVILSTMTESLFVYGSLMFPRVLEILLQRVPPSRAARLEGFIRLKVLDDHYPVLLPGGGAVEGRLLEGLTAQELGILDAFEGQRYDRLRVTVLSNGVEIATHAYVLKDQWRHLAGGPWDPREFETRHLEAFIRRYAGFRN